jgi:RNA polymerase sigma-70 factor (sigma-E family)
VDRFDSEEKSRRNEFERFALGISPMLLRSAYLLTRDHADAEDLLQATLFRVARRWEAIEASRAGYAYRVLVNLARDRRRNRGRRPVEEPESDRSSEYIQDPTQRVIERDVMTAMVRRLPAKQREVIVLRFFVDLSLADTAAAMGCSEGTVKSHTSRALASMRAFMDPDAAGNRWMEVPHAE